jgi:hypothetical protein
VLAKIRRLRELSEAERHLIARSLATTPDERWRLHESFLRSQLIHALRAEKIRFQIAGMSGAIL